MSIVQVDIYGKAVNNIRHEVVFIKGNGLTDMKPLCEGSHQHFWQTDFGEANCETCRLIKNGKRVKDN